MSNTLVYKITFLRHGESIGNLERRFQGHSDFPLTDTGRAQVVYLANSWQTKGLTFDQVISSPLARARETAEIICKTLNASIEYDQDWKEIDNGLLAGLTDEEASQSIPRPQFMTPYTRYGKTGESRLEVYLRAGNAIQRILDRPAGCYLVVAHGGILNIAMYAILGIPIQADSTGPRFMFHNTTFVSFEYTPERHNWYMIQFEHNIL